MTITELVAELNARTDEYGDAMHFGGFAAHYDISDEEAERIAARATSVAEFEAIWENETWWVGGIN